MKLGKALCTTLVAMAIFVALSAASKSKDSRNVLLHYDATIEGSHLTSGEYDVQWQTHSPAATVSFSRKNQVVATVEGKIVDRGTKYSATQVVYSQSPSGYTVQEIRFKGSSEAIDFD
jgi:hypothetical protein